MNIEELLQPIMFNSRVVSQALDNYDPADPHRRADEFDDEYTAPQVNKPFYDTSTVVPMTEDDSNISLVSLPDYSDEVISDFQIQRMLGKPVNMENVVDLDTAPNYVNFVKNTIKNVIQSENEFNIDAVESQFLKQTTQSIV
jgi:hypothetical protein